MTLAQAVREYLQWLEERGYSQWTVHHRRSYLGYLVGWCSERGIDAANELTRLVLERYQKSVAHQLKADGSPLSFHAQHLRLTAVKALCQWLARQRILLYNPASELELPRLGRRLPRAVLTASEVETLLNVPDVRTPRGVRDRAILEVLYSTGLRRSEVIRLTVYAVDFERGTLLVDQGKGKKDRFVPIGERALAWMRLYLEEVRPALAIAPDDGTLFLTKYGRPFSPNGMSTLVRRLIDSAKLGKSGSCHMLRHAMATVMLENGADVRFIQQMLGHASVRTTQIYTHVAIRTLKAVHQATHPSARSRPSSRAAVGPGVSAARVGRRPEGGAIRIALDEADLDSLDEPLDDEELLALLEADGEDI